ncbi:MAG TPA: outer membrane beta-barrel protein [Puia sp.]|nr:outer membrane beta-barrel protein [Puia sp.]
MKKFAYGFIILVNCLFVFNTQSNAQVMFGPSAGFTAAGLYTNDDNVYAGINGQIGATVHFQITDFLAVRPSVLYRFGSMANSNDNTDKISLNRIAIPVPIVYSHIFPNNGILFGGVGPNFMYNLSGTQENYYQSGKIIFSGDNAQMQRFDVGLDFTGGYQFSKGLSLSLFLNAGLSNISKSPGTTLHSLDAFGFSIGWMFGNASNE